VRQKTNNTVALGICVLLCLLLCTGNYSFAQNTSLVSTKALQHLRQEGGWDKAFIENIGQYGKTMAGYENMGTIKYGYEGLGMPVLFTPKGLIYLQRKVTGLTHRQEEKLEKQGLPEEEIERQKNVTDRVIAMEWMNANPAMQMITEDKTTAYHTYGTLNGKAYGYRKIIYKNIYPGIDIICNFNDNEKAGFEYTLIAQPGADLSVVQMSYGGDVKNIKTDSKGNLVINSDIDGIAQTIPVSYYGDRLINQSTSDVKTVFKIDNNQVSFYFPQRL